MYKKSKIDEVKCYPTLREDVTVLHFLCMTGLNVSTFEVSVGKTLCLHASCVCQCMCLSVCQTNLVYTSCVIHICLTQRRIRFVCGMLMPYNVENIMQAGLLGSKAIKGLVETLR